MLSASDSLYFSFMFGNYRISDQANKAADANITYMGLLDKKGNWYILQQTRSGTTISYRYIKGDSAYATSWNNREILTYGYFDATFK